MSKGSKIALGVVGALLLLILIVGSWVAGSYNTLVQLDQATQAQWGQVENTYQRRADLVPNLVATVKGAAKFEQDTLTAVTEARAKVGQVSGAALGNVANNPEAFKKFQDAQAQLSGALGRLLAVSESYPDLKSNQNFLALQSQLEGTENRIAVARRDYIEAVRVYNTELRTFPGVIWASTLYKSNKPMQEFTVAEDLKQPPQIKF